MKYFIILLIASFVFFGCDANNAGDDSGIASGDGSPQDDGSGSNEDEDPQDDNGGSNADDNGGSNADDDPQVADLCLGVNTSSITHTLDDGKDYTIIRDQVGLQKIENSLTAHYILCNNISLNGPFTRIRGEFTGTLEGNYKTISNLEIQTQSINFVGLFERIDANGEVRNLHVSLTDGSANNPSISGNTYVGVLAGKNMGTITNVGITDGYVKGSANNVGGLVGWNEGGTIEHSYAISEVGSSGGSQVGGLVGLNAGTITESYAAGIVTGGGSSIGGLVGYNSGTITASYFDATPTATSTGQSGTSIQGVTAYYTHSDGQVYTLADGVGDLVAQDDFVDNNNWNFNTIWASQGDGQWPILQFQAIRGIATYRGESYLVITDQVELQAIGDDLSAKYILSDDIRLDVPFTKIEGEFTGTLEGKYKTISNLNIQAENSEYVGLFGVIAGEGEVRNLKLSLASGSVNNPSILGLEYVGALTGHNMGTITNVGVTDGYVKGAPTIDWRKGRYTGGLVGYNDGGTITSSYTSDIVTTEGGTGVGGLVGKNNGKINTSHASGTVTGIQYTGGLVGHNERSSINTIWKSYATGTVTTTTESSYGIGGLVGYNDYGYIAKSYATGSVITTFDGSAAIGGLVGWNKGGRIEHSYATGAATAPTADPDGGQKIGGLVGNNEGGTITASYATGTVTGSDSPHQGSLAIGGLVGYNDGGSSTASYFDAATTEQSLFIGNESVADRAYYTDTTSANREVYTQANGTGDKIDQSNFPDWDATIWTWQEGQWPTFQFQ